MSNPNIERHTDHTFSYVEGIATIDVNTIARQWIEFFKKRDPDYYSDIVIDEATIQSLAQHLMEFMEGVLDDGNTFVEWFWKKYKMNKGEK
jgi:hypothetical protein